MGGQDVAHLHRAEPRQDVLVEAVAVAFASRWLKDVVREPPTVDVVLELQILVVGAPGRPRVSASADARRAACALRREGASGSLVPTAGVAVQGSPAQRRSLARVSSAWPRGAGPVHDSSTNSLITDCHELTSN